MPFGSATAGGTDPTLVKMYELMQKFREDFRNQNRPSGGKSGAKKQERPENNQTEYPVNVRPEDAAALRDRDEAQQPLNVRTTERLPRARPIPTSNEDEEVSGPLGTFAGDLLDEIHNSVAPNEDANMTNVTPDAPPPPPPPPRPVPATENPEYKDDVELPDAPSAAPKAPKGKAKLKPVLTPDTAEQPMDDADAWSADAAAATQVLPPDQQTINEATGTPAQPVEPPPTQAEVPVTTVIRRGHTLDDLIQRGGLDEATANTIRQDAQDGSLTRDSVNTMTAAIAKRQNARGIRQHAFGTNVAPHGDLPSVFNGAGNRAASLPVPTPPPPPTESTSNKRGREEDAAVSAKIPRQEEAPSILGKRPREEERQPTRTRWGQGPAHIALQHEADQERAHGDISAEDLSLIAHNIRQNTSDEAAAAAHAERVSLAAHDAREALRDQHAERVSLAAHDARENLRASQNHAERVSLAAHDAREGLRQSAADIVYENEHLENHDVLVDAGIHDYTYGTGGGGMM